MRYERFHLVLMVTHACNLRCDYCYVGQKRPQTMPLEMGCKAIDRAIRSIRPGGTLDLGFFGGEPLLEAARIAEWFDYAQQACAAHGHRLTAGLTTNGTLADGPAWELLIREDLDVCVSHDGLPEVHDRHRVGPDGSGTAEQALDTIQRLKHAGRPVRAVMVVRPDSVAALPEGILWLRAQGVWRVDLTLDVWATWQSSDVVCLEQALAGTADVWRSGLPEGGINWFDEKATHLLRLPMDRSGRCGFGDGEVAVAPSGNLYPCERLIGEDGPGHPLRLPGHVMEGDHFPGVAFPGRSTAACSACQIQTQCNTTCRCNNYVRTGDPSRPDALVCLLDKVCYREIARVLRQMTAASGVAGEEDSICRVGRA
jgi:uncharacterized protein